ncbi:hypothetical protein [Natrinema sp. 1APR25-10V2]|uniref:hypothetical protein n=1 Tax=Natrinema sp. 1APR25-10V2 TaxID=2951081 RepID=UPI002876CE1A|nr:hypothetical protein [Natrinema sp. 1APR25-10V2]MDS0476827.1 hypothetical protein [Natrinema sp. 1APR25-10V2]
MDNKDSYLDREIERFVDERLGYSNEDVDWDLGCLDNVRDRLEEQVEELSYQLADAYMSADEPTTVLIGTTETVYDDVRQQCTEKGYEFEQFQYGSFQIRDVSQEDIGDLLQTIRPRNMETVIDQMDGPRSVSLTATADRYESVASYWAAAGYDPVRLSHNILYISEMAPADIDELIHMPGVEAVTGSDPPPI